MIGPLLGPSPSLKFVQRLEQRQRKALQRYEQKRNRCLPEEPLEDMEEPDSRHRQSPPGLVKFQAYYRPWPNVSSEINEEPSLEDAKDVTSREVVVD